MKERALNGNERGFIPGQESHCRRSSPRVCIERRRLCIGAGTKRIARERRRSEFAFGRVEFALVGSLQSVSGGRRRRMNDRVRYHCGTGRAPACSASARNSDLWLSLVHKQGDVLFMIGLFQSTLDTSMWSCARQKDGVLTRGEAPPCLVVELSICGPVSNPVYSAEYFWEITIR